jgi:hypothetical protein
MARPIRNLKNPDPHITEHPTTIPGVVEVRTPDGSSFDFRPQSFEDMMETSELLKRGERPRSISDDTLLVGLREMQAYTSLSPRYLRTLLAGRSPTRVHGKVLLSQHSADQLIEGQSRPEPLIRRRRRKWLKGRREIADYSGASVRTVSRWLAANRFPHHRPSCKLVMVHPDDLDPFLKSINAQEDR